ncbi:MAG TPA: hypothetical protein VEK39_06525 [Solirubrobacterales bacterium]|nr:hypothetical protein [Solirubrobacterales bacterium]
MGLLSRTKQIVTDQTGGVEPVPIGLERNPGAVVELGADNPPDVPLYVLRVGLESGFGRTQAGLPVYRRDNPSPHPILKEIYRCEVAGKVLEAANVYALRDKVQRQLEMIAPGHSLPLCYFRAPRFDYSLPIHEAGSRVVCPVLAGPKIKADGLDEIREPVTRHLRSAGYLAPDEEPEVLVVRPSDLRLVPPAAVIRSLDDPSLWHPTVEGTSDDGPVVGLLAHPAELRYSGRRRPAAASEGPPLSAPDITGLLRQLGAEMVQRGRTRNPWALYATDVRMEIWARTEEVTDPTPNRLTCRMEGGESLEVPVRHTAAGELVAALQERGITVFLAGDLDALRASVGRYLTEAGFLRHPSDLRQEAIRERPAESLDPDSISTGESLDWGHAPGTELERLELDSDTQTAIEDREVASK